MKYLRYMLVFFVCCFSCSFSVYADAEQNHIYMIEKANFTSNDKLELSGYSYGSHMDNYGGLNVFTYIIAYTGKVGDNDQDWYKSKGGIFSEKWDADCVDCNVSDLKAECENDPQHRCYIQQANYTGGDDARDFYYARCIAGGCEKKSYQEVWKWSGAKKSAGVYNPTSSCANSGNDIFKNSYYFENSHCLYWNVGFSVSLDLNVMYSTFFDYWDSNNISEDNRKVNFAIILYTGNNVSVADMAAGKYHRHVFSTNLGVYPDFCQVNGIAGSCGTEGNKKINPGGSFEIDVGKMEKKVKMDAINARIMVDNGSGYQVINPAASYNPVFTSGVYYDVQTIRTMQTLGKTGFVDESDTVGYNGKWIDTMFLLKTTKNNGNSVSPGNSEAYWATGNWLKVTGQFMLNGIKKNVIKLDCDDIDHATNKNAVDNCNTDETAQFAECGVKKNLMMSDMIFYPSSNDTDSCFSYYWRINGKNYVSVGLKTDVLIYQNATFNFGTIPEKDGIRAGKGFSLNGATYQNNITWYNANLSSDGVTPYYQYIGNDYVLSGGSCKSQTINFSKDDLVLYCLDPSGCTDDYQSATLEEASRQVINYKVKTMINESNIENITYKSCDSNDSSGCTVENPNFSVDGSWTKVVEESVVASTNTISSPSYNIKGGTFTNVYNYSLPNSYVIVSGDSPGKAEYKKNAEETISNAVSTGNKFYIDFKYVYNSVFPFNLNKDINPSFLSTLGDSPSSMSWKLNGTCAVNVKDGYYTEGEGGNPATLLRYRSINVDNPFPKGNVAINWQDWWQVASNKTRISNSYEDYPNNPLYEINMSKYNVENAINLSDIIEYGESNVNDSYVSTQTIDLDGSSKFVRLFFNVFVRESDRLYCPLGTFKQECDLGVR